MKVPQLDKMLCDWKEKFASLLGLNSSDYLSFKQLLC
jgi:hypothetical protein